MGGCTPYGARYRGGIWGPRRSLCKPMGSAPTPTPHTPINFLKAGGNAMFSAECIAALAKCNYEPEDFGSYDQVSKRIDKARAKTSAYDEWVAKGRPATRPKDFDKDYPKRGPWPPPAPTDRERWLSTCQAGHLGQNACRQRGRGDPCSNLVDGYQDNLAACMPHQGQAFGANNLPRTDTEHGWWTQHEQDSPVHRLDANYQPRGREGAPTRDNLGYVENGGRAPAPNCQYTQDEMRSDDRARTREFLERHKDSRPAPTSAQPQGGTQSGGTGAASGVAGAKGVAANSNAPSGGGGPRVITGSDAAECISNFKEMAEDAMRRKCADDVEANREEANGGPGRTPAQGEAHRAALRDRYERSALNHDLASREAEHMRRSRGQRARHYEDARDRAWADPTPANQAALQRERAAYAQSIRETRASEAREARYMSERRQNAAAYNSAREANCLADQGERIRAGQARVDGRSPGVVNEAPQTPPLAFAPFNLP